MPARDLRFSTWRHDTANACRGESFLFPPSGQRGRQAASEAWARRCTSRGVAEASSGGMRPPSTRARKSASIKGKWASWPTSRLRGRRDLAGGAGGHDVQAWVRGLPRRHGVREGRPHALPVAKGNEESRRRKPVPSCCSTRISARVPRITERWVSPPRGARRDPTRVSRAAVTAPRRKVSSALAR